MDLKTFGLRIRSARERLGLKQGELAERLGKNQNAISEYENGDRKVPATELPQLAEALEVPLLYFYEGELIPNEIDINLLTEFHKLPEELKNDAIEAIRFLVAFAQKSRGN